MSVVPGKLDSKSGDKSLALFVMLAVAGLHLFFLFHAGALWRDEVNGVNLASSGSLGTMTRDSFPVLFPLIIKAWTLWGFLGSDFGLRILGTLIGILLPVALWAAAQAARRAIPFFGLVLLGLNGTAIFWGDSLRAFGLGSALIVLTVAGMCRLLGKPTWRRTAELSLIASLSVQVLYQNAVLFAAIGVGGWLVCWSRRDGWTALKILISGAVAFVCLLPYWDCVVKWSGATSVIRPGFSWTAAAGNFAAISGFPLPEVTLVWVLLGVAVLVFGVMAVPGPCGGDAGAHEVLTMKESQLFAGATLLLSLVAYYLFLRFAALITEPWYFLPLAAIVAVAFDIGIPLVRFARPARVGIGSALAATAVISVVFSVRDLNCRLTNVDLVAKYLQEKVSPKDYVLVTPWYLGVSFNRYYHGAASWETLPPVADHMTHRFDLVPNSTNAVALAEEPVLDRAATTLREGHRVWVAGWMSVPAKGRKSATAEGLLLAGHSMSFKNVDLKISGQTSDYEIFSLLLAEGWRTNSP